MKFPVKKAKPGAGNNGLSNNIFRREFLEDMPSRVRNTVRGVDLMLINEALTSIANGNVQINGKKPVTRLERFVVIASYFKTARTSLNMAFDGTLTIEDNYTVVFKGADQTSKTIVLPIQQQQ